MNPMNPDCYRCGHDRNAHDHYRDNLDCAACKCTWFVHRTWWRVLLHDITGGRMYTETGLAAGVKH